MFINQTDLLFFRIIFRSKLLPGQQSGRPIVFFVAFEKFGFSNEADSKVIDPVILNLFQDPNALYRRSRNKFGMT